MKRLFVLATMLVAAISLSAQTPHPVKSPAAVESATIGGKSLTIHYASPHLNGRTGHVFTKDGLISHDPTYPIWRAGANAATTLHTDAALSFDGLAVPAGTYTLFVDLSDADNWVLIVNKQTGQWGTDYDKAQDLGRIKLTTTKSAQTVQNLKFTLTSKGNMAGTLTLAWENVTASAAFTLHQ